MLTIKTEEATVEIYPDSHFSLSRGGAEEDNVYIAWDNLQEHSKENLKRLEGVIKDSLKSLSDSIE